MGGLTLANLLTVSRMALIPFFILAVTDNRFGTALIIFGIAGATDFLDGIIARWWRQKTTLGAILDPLADKLLLAAAFIVLAMPDHPKALPEFELLNRIPITLAIISISRDVIIAIIAGVLYVSGARTSFPPSIFGKLTTTVQIFLVLGMLYWNYQGIESDLVLPLIIKLTWGLVIVSGIHYIYSMMKGGKASDAEQESSSS
jgi:cardiolipin synthase